MFLRDMKKLTLDDNGVLYRYATDKQQLVILKKLTLLAFTELHVKTEHFGQDSTP